MADKPIKSIKLEDVGMFRERWLLQYFEDGHCVKEKEFDQYRPAKIAADTYMGVFENPFMKGHTR